MHGLAPKVMRKFELWRIDASRSNVKAKKYHVTFEPLFDDMHQSFPAYLAGIRVTLLPDCFWITAFPSRNAPLLSGFQSTTAFNKAFHEITGYAPEIIGSFAFAKLSP